MGMHCPQCCQIDMVQAVPAIVQNGSNTFNYQAPIGFAYKGTGGTFMVNKEGRVQSDLARVLEGVIPKEYEKIKGEEYKQFRNDIQLFYGMEIKKPHISRLWIVLIFILIAIGFIGKINNSMIVQLVASVSGIWIIISKLIEKKPQYKEYLRLCNDFITHMQRRWWESFYFGRCNVVFIPDKPGYKSVYDMKEFIMKRD